MKKVRWWILFPLLFLVGGLFVVFFIYFDYNPKAIWISFVQDKNVQSEIDERERLATQVETRISVLNSQKEMIDGMSITPATIDSVLATLAEFLTELNDIQSELERLVQQDKELIQKTSLKTQQLLRLVVEVDTLVLDSQLIAASIYERKYEVLQLQKHRLSAGECLNAIEYSEQAAQQVASQMTNCLPNLRNLESGLQHLMNAYEGVDGDLKRYTSLWLTEVTVLKDSYAALADGQPEKAAQFVAQYEQIGKEKSVFDETEAWNALQQSLTGELEENMKKKQQEIDTLSRKLPSD